MWCKFTPAASVELSEIQQNFIYLFTDFGEIAFSALTLLAGSPEEHLACKNWLSVCREGDANDLHMGQLMPVPPDHLLLHYNPGPLEC